jgi:V-type H+-transporting ATPase subunit E
MAAAKTAGAMSDKEVKAQLDRMVSFILREADEKANEVRINAEDEFSAQRQSAVQGEKLKLMKEYEKKEKQVDIEKRITFSNAINQSRLRVLRAREELLAKIVADAQKRLASMGEPGEPYKKLLRDLILQGLLKLQEDKVSLRCRETDQGLVKEVLSDAINLYKQKTGNSAVITIDTNWLPSAYSASHQSDFCSGGVILSAQDGRILCNNTLDQRLLLSYEQLLPEIRKALFGKSATRKFNE